MSSADQKQLLCRLISDKEVARLVSMSPSWVRKERFNRRHGQPHCFEIDPVMIGTSPRYRLADVTTWIEQLINKQNSKEF